MSGTSIETKNTTERRLTEARKNLTVALPGFQIVGREDIPRSPNPLTERDLSIDGFTQLGTYGLRHDLANGGWDDKKAVEALMKVKPAPPMSWVEVGGLVAFGVGIGALAGVMVFLTTPATVASLSLLGSIKGGALTGGLILGISAFLGAMFGNHQSGVDRFEKVKQEVIDSGLLSDANLPPPSPSANKGKRSFLPVFAPLWDYF